MYVKKADDIVVANLAAAPVPLVGNAIIIIHDLRQRLRDNRSLVFALVGCLFPWFSLHLVGWWCVCFESLPTKRQVTGSIPASVCYSG